MIQLSNKLKQPLAGQWLFFAQRSLLKLSVFSSPALIPLEFNESLNPRVGHAVHADPVHFVRHTQPALHISAQSDHQLCRGSRRSAEVNFRYNSTSELRFDF